MTDQEEVAALRQRVDELARLFQKFHRAAILDVAEQRRLTVGVARFLLESITSVGAQVSILQWALLSSKAVTAEQLEQAEKDVKAGLAGQTALHPEWSAQTEELRWLEAELEADLREDKEN
jgi:hypothetical protein